MEHQSIRPSESVEGQPDLPDQPESSIDEPELIPQDEDRQPDSTTQVPPPAAEPRAGSTQSVNPLLLGLTLAIVFLLGLGLGFLGRPALIKDLPIEVVVTVVPNESEAVAQADAQPEASGSGNRGAASGEAQSGMSSSGDNSAANPTPTIMDFVLSDARHIQGSDAAPVTVIEFSDFN